MPLTLLLDLDDTLLDTNLDAFMPAYFQALANHVCGHVPSEKLLRALIGGVNQMNENDDPRRTLQDVFDSSFYSDLGIPKNELSDVIEDFYDRVFPALSIYTKQKPDAIEFVNWAMAQGFQIAVATDPLFPYKATHQRIRWAGFEPDQFELVSTMEHFHFTKSHPAYYAEMLGRLGWSDGAVLMVGNDVNRDIVPANRLGVRTFLVEAESGSKPNEAGRGTFADLRRWLESVELSALEPSFKSREGVLGIMQSTPAVLNSLLSPLSEERCRCEPARDDWAMNEIVCHLRDTEREVHTRQLELLVEKSDAFIPRPDTAVWASERDYLNEDTHAALASFSDARVDLLTKLKHLPEEVWVRKARHAIFGPTDFLEIMSFVGDHDRMHLQQASKTLQRV
jgi:FMN phosphatase YigB (HAD superfamily)